MATEKRHLKPFHVCQRHHLTKRNIPKWSLEQVISVNMKNYCCYHMPYSSSADVENLILYSAECRRQFNEQSMWAERQTFPLIAQLHSPDSRSPLRSAQTPFGRTFPVAEVDGHYALLTDYSAKVTNWSATSLPEISKGSGTR